MTDYVFRYGTDGVELNSDVTVDAPFVDIEKVTGLSSAPFRVTERTREGMDGGFIDAEFEEPRTIVLDGTVYVNDFDLLEEYLDQLKENYAPAPSSRPLFFSAPGVGQRLLFCKSFGVRYDWDQARRIGSSPIQIQLGAEDPTIYGVSLISEQTGLGEAETGRSYDKSYSYGYGPPAFGGRVLINNVGNRPTGATITITGPITNPIITHDVTNRRLEFDIVLSPTQSLVINLRNRTVLLNGTANRRSALLTSSRWFMLAKGNNALRFRGERHMPEPEPIMKVEARAGYR